MMDSQKKLYKVVAVHKSRAAEIGRWLWALQDARRRTLFELNGISPHIIDWHPQDDATSIGTILYHLDDIEADYLYVEVFEEMELVEFRRVRSFPHLEVTPEWVLHCLSQHEAEHRSQIVWLRQRAELVQ